LWTRHRGHVPGWPTCSVSTSRGRQPSNLAQSARRSPTQLTGRGQAPQLLKHGRALQAGTSRIGPRNKENGRSKRRKNPETKAGRHFNETKEMQPKQNNGKTCPGPGQQKDRDNATQNPRNQGKEGTNPPPQNQRTPDTRHRGKTWRNIEREKDKDETHNGPGTSGKPRQTKTKPAP